MDLTDAKDFLNSYDDVKSRLSVGNPRQHGNGFFQLDLYNEYRLHVWDPAYPLPQKVATPIHDHRFAFESLVLYGTQKHVTYNITITYNSRIVTPTHQIYEANPDIMKILY